MEQNLIKVYSKDNQLLAVFSNEGDGLSPDAMKDLMVAPTVRLESGGIASFSFQMLADSRKWRDIQDPTNTYHVDGRVYSPLNENAYQYTSEEGVSIVNVVALEIEALLSMQYHQIFNAFLYAYCRGTFLRFENDAAVFQLNSAYCDNPGSSVASSILWNNSVVNWTPYDDNGNRNSFSILTADNYKPVGWEPPSAVFMRSLSVNGSTATMVVESRTKHKTNHVFNYNPGRTYRIDSKPLPTSIDGVKVNSTVVTTSGNTATYSTSDKDVYNYSYNASTGVVTVNYNFNQQVETINAITISYTYNDLGEIKPGAQVWFSHGAEVIDQHTVCLLPKSKSKYLLTIDGQTIPDSQVRDSRGAIMPRGSAGYYLFALLKNTSWEMGICDVLARGFDTSIDYGCFQLESDAKSTLENLQALQSLYGGILVFDSLHKIVHLRAENNEDYQSYTADGFNEWRGQVFREGKNMTEKPEISVDNKITTRLYPLGYGGLNIKPVNNNKTWIDNFSYTQDIYEGYLEQPLIHYTNDDGGSLELLYWAEKELKKMCRPRTSVKLSVTDLRYLPEYSHEVFDINDIAKVYYWDDNAQENVIENQRIIVREYNPFFLPESEIELGDVTLNKTDLFKLIYKKVQNNPAADNSGNISGSNVTIDSDSYDPNSLPSYIQLIARTTTENSDAIAGLILDTDANHAQATLFAQYQHHMDGLLAETFAGATAYTDKEMAAFQITVGGKWEEQNQKIEANYNRIVALTKEASMIDEKLEQRWEDITKTGKTEIKAVTGLREEISKNYALKSEFTGYKKEVSDEIGTKIKGAKTEILQYADDMIGAIQFNVAATTDRYGEPNGLRVTFGSKGITIENVRYDLTAFTDITLPLSSYIPETIINSADLVFNLDNQINGRNGLYDRVVEVQDDLDGWRYYGSTYIDGSKIMTGTVSATKLEGGTISLLDSNGYDAGFFTVRGASSYSGQAVSLYSGAIGVEATDGDVYIYSNRQIQLRGRESIYLDSKNVESGSDITIISDKKAKKDINYDISKYLKMFDYLKPCSYKMIDGTSGRTHIGMIANDVEQVLYDSGMNTKEFAAYVQDQDEKSKNYGVRGLRYGEFVGLCIAKIQEQDKEIKEIKALLKQ